MLIACFDSRTSRFREGDLDGKHELPPDTYELIYVDWRSISFSLPFNKTIEQSAVKVEIDPELTKLTRGKFKSFSAPASQPLTASESKTREKLQPDFVVPCVVQRVTKECSGQYSLSCLNFSWPNDFSCTILPAGNDLWLEAALRLAEKTFRNTLAGPLPAIPKVAHWIAGGDIKKKGYQQPPKFQLERMILMLWDKWQSPEFHKVMHRRYKVWGARHQSILSEGYSEPLSVGRLKQAFYAIFPADNSDKWK